MLLTETHHAAILVEFYKELMSVCGEARGYDVFMTAGRSYGSRRGRRMALRAMRDGNPLDTTSYFAYGELLCTEGGYAGELYEAFPGVVHEHQEECMWAEVFHRECHQCGVDYCREIDEAIVRGFNPTLQFECMQNMHLTHSCDFYYHGKEITADFMSTYSSRLAPGASTKREMAYHCADMYDMYCYVIRSVLPDRAQDIISAVRGRLAEKYGLGFLPALDAYQSTDFNQI